MVAARDRRLRVLLGAERALPVETVLRLQEALAHAALPSLGFSTVGISRMLTNSFFRSILKSMLLSTPDRGLRPGFGRLRSSGCSAALRILCSSCSCRLAGPGSFGAGALACPVVSGSWAPDPAGSCPVVSGVSSFSFFRRRVLHSGPGIGAVLAAGSGTRWLADSGLGGRPGYGGNSDLVARAGHFLRCVGAKVVRPGASSSFLCSIL